jgi:hypothetical protein
MQKVSIIESDIAIEAPAKVTRKLRNELMTYGYHFDSQRHIFRSPLYKAAILRLQDIKAFMPLTWTGREVEIFAKVLSQ